MQGLMFSLVGLMCLFLLTLAHVHMCRGLWCVCVCVYLCALFLRIVKYDC